MDTRNQVCFFRANPLFNPVPLQKGIGAGAEEEGAVADSAGMRGGG